MFKNVLKRQLNTQLQLVNLGEYHGAATEKQKSVDVLEKGEGMEAILGQVATYSSQVQALFLTPITLIYIILFANETKIP
jgi:hypothetical protein